MSLQKEARFRINARQTAKGRWQFEATVEYGDDKIQISSNKDGKDLGDVKMGTLGMKLLSLIKETEKAFKEDGREIVTKVDGE